MVPTFIDLETFYSRTHSLTKLSPMEYVMHPDTQLISCSIAVGMTAEPDCVFGERDIRARLAELDPSKTYAIAHNMSGFDALVLAWRLGFKPALWGCTLAMARPIHAKDVGLSLAKLVAHYAPELRAMGVKDVKDSTALVQTLGKRLEDFTPDERRAMAAYNKDDTAQCRGLFRILKRHYNASELWHIHAKIRALVEPKFEVDTALLETALSVERSNKLRSLLEVAKIMKLTDLEWGDSDAVVERVRAELASAPKFSALLESQGVPVPTKPSPTNPQVLIPALAKTDAGFEALLAHDNEIVAAAARARLQVKSTLAETRMQAFVDAAQHTGGRWPVTVHYCGADTTGRASGWHYNPLNLPRVNPKKPQVKDALRRSLRAPAGHVVVVADLSGIEMRFNHFLWKVPYSTRLWQQDPEADVYRASYAIKLGIAPEQVTSEQRQVSKVENLGLGYGMGYVKYREEARKASMLLSEEESAEAVADWRRRHIEIVRGWKTCHTALGWIAAGIEREIDPWGLFTTCAQGIRLPSGRLIRYPDLRKETRYKVDESGELVEDGFEWVYGQSRHKARIYAGKVTENLVQAGARDVLYDVAYDVYRQTGLCHELEVYDELVYIVPEKDAADVLNLVQQRMRTPPKWWPALVTWSEGDIAHSYGDAK